jgi:ClpX C4-type zinc finger.
MRLRAFTLSFEGTKSRFRSVTNNITRVSVEAIELLLIPCYRKRFSSVNSTRVSKNHTSIPNDGRICEYAQARMPMKRECSFCKLPKTNILLIAGRKALICKDCVELCNGARCDNESSADIVMSSRLQLHVQEESAGIRCSFCSQFKNEAVADSKHIFICFECLDLSNEILSEPLPGRLQKSVEFSLPITDTPSLHNIWVALVSAVKGSK